MALTQKQILDTLNRITMPDGRGLADAGMVRNLELSGSSVRVLLAVEDPGLASTVRADAQRALSAIEGLEDVHVSVPVGMPMSGAGQAATQERPGPAWADRIPGVRRVIAVASGKGGVGKSTVAANLALGLARQGRSVGLLDADIYGPSQQLMMNLTQDPAGDPASGKILPIDAAGGVKVMSFGCIIDVDQPVIWRGPMLMKALEQFIGDVAWGELDFLIIDLPPGTGDVALTLCQNVPLAGAVIVTTPQDVALIDVRKGLNMFRRLEVPVLGLVENMAHFTCPGCGRVEYLFGSGGGERTATQLEIPFLGAIPIDPAVVAGGDSGRPVVLDRPDSPSARAFVDIAAALLDTPAAPGQS
jgi:ATP-binding protein involved in chromosome partitioning